MRIEPRLRKIEAAFERSSPVRRYTYDEVEIAGYEFRRAILASDHFLERHSKLAARICSMEEEIRAQAQKHAGEQYHRHIDEWVTEMWLASGHSLPFVSPVIGSEYEAWDHPNLAARRLAVRLRPSVIALIGEPIEVPHGLLPAAPFDPIDVIRSLKTASR